MLPLIILITRYVSISYTNKHSLLICSVKHIDLLRNQICKAIEFSYLGNIWSELLHLKIFLTLLIFYVKF